jgi:GNAT superfamily N-acetyltransferase
LDVAVTPSVRPAVESDVSAIHALVVELATYERAADQVRATPDALRTALFGEIAPGRGPAAYAFVGEVDGEVAGFALWFLSFSTWEGVHGIYLEDLFVSPAHRGTGLGRALLAALARTAVERGYARVEWAVLNWNTPAIGFYERIGARPQQEWTTYRLTGEALSDAARETLAPRPRPNQDTNAATSDPPAPISIAVP